MLSPPSLGYPHPLCVVPALPRLSPPSTLHLTQTQGRTCGVSSRSLVVDLPDPESGSPLAVRACRRHELKAACSDTNRPRWCVTTSFLLSQITGTFVSPGRAALGGAASGFTAGIPHPGQHGAHPDAAACSLGGESHVYVIN